MSQRRHKKELSILDNVSSLTDHELRSALKSYEVSAGPITDSTRTLYRKKLASLIESQSHGEAISFTSNLRSLDSQRGQSAGQPITEKDDEEDDTSDEDFEVQEDEEIDEEEDSEELEEEEEDLMSELQDEDVTLSRISGRSFGDVSTRSSLYPEASANRISRSILISIISFFVIIFGFYLLSSNNLQVSERLKEYRYITKWLVLILALSPFGYILYRTIRYYRHRSLVQSQRVCQLVSEALELLQSPDNPKGLMPILHIRDTLLTPAERKTKQMVILWQKAVKFIEEHESRVKVELVNIDGEDFRAWKWIGSRKL